MYKHQLVFNRIANGYFSDSLIPAFLSGGMVVLAVLLVSIIHNSHLLPPAIFLNFVVGIILILIAIRFLLNISGKLLKNSRKVLFHLRWITRRKRLERRIVLGLGDLRVYMRGMMFFQKVQFLLYLRVVLMRTINFLLITRGRLN